VRSLTNSDLPDTDDIVPFEYTTLINQNKRAEYKNAEWIDQINRSGIFEGTMLSVSDKSIKSHILGFAIF